MLTDENCRMLDLAQIRAVLNCNITFNEYFRLATCVRNSNFDRQGQADDINSIYEAKMKGSRKYRRFFVSGSWTSRPLSNFCNKTTLVCGPEANNLLLTGNLLSLSQSNFFHAHEQSFFYRHFSNTLKWNNVLCKFKGGVIPECSYCVNDGLRPCQIENFAHMTTCSSIEEGRDYFFSNNFFNRAPERSWFFKGSNFTQQHRSENLVFNICLLFWIKIVYTQRISRAKLTTSRFMNLLSDHILLMTRGNSKMASVFRYHGSKYPLFLDLLYNADNNFPS